MSQLNIDMRTCRNKKFKLIFDGEKEIQSRYSKSSTQYIYKLYRGYTENARKQGVNLRYVIFGK